MLMPARRNGAATPVRRGDRSAHTHQVLAPPWQQPRAPAGGSSGIALHRSVPTLATTAANKLSLRALDTGEFIASHTLKPTGVYACTFSPEGASVAAASADGIVRVWSL